MTRILFVASLAAVLMSCDHARPESTGVIPLSIRPVLNQQLFETGIRYQNLQGRQFQFDNLSLYLSELTLIHQDGTEILVKSADQEEAVLLFDFARGELYGATGEKSANGALLTSPFDVPAGTYQGIKFTLGVPRSLNGDFDPVTYPIDHPLSEQRGAFWTWNSGYIFLKIDGQIDNSQSANGQSLDGSITYHTGLDTLIRTVSFLDPQHTFSIEAGEIPTEELRLTFDISKLFYLEGDTLDMLSQNLTHTTNDFDLAETIMTNLATHALTLE